MSKANAWDLLKRQFDALMHDDSVGCAESIDDIFDVQFRHRFTELINQTAQRNSTTSGIIGRDARTPMDYKIGPKRTCSDECLRFIPENISISPMATSSDKTGAS